MWAGGGGGDFSTVPVELEGWSRRGLVLKGAEKKRVGTEGGWKRRGLVQKGAGKGEGWKRRQLQV